MGLKKDAMTRIHLNMFTKVECLLHELRRSLSCWCMNDDWRKWFLSLPKVVICKLFYWLDVSHGLKTAAAATGYLFTSPPVADVEWVWQSDGGDGEFGIEQQVQGVEARWRLSKRMKEWVKASTRLGTSMVYTDLKSVVSRKVWGQARGEPFLNRMEPWRDRDSGILVMKDKDSHWRKIHRR